MMAGGGPPRPRITVLKSANRNRYARETGILVRRDRVLREIARRVGPCTLAPSKNHFVTLAEAILWQQLSWKAALSIHARLLETLGRKNPRPEDIARVSDSALAKAGVSRQKIAYLKGLAGFFEEKRFPLRTIHRHTNEEISRMLTELKGIGPWTVDMYLIFGLNRLDVFPAGDLGLKKSIGAHYGFDGLNDTRHLEAVTENWRPYRTIGAWYLWASADSVPLGAAPRGE
jgi:DNA-3-methyladenine glycosylase II